MDSESAINNADLFLRDIPNVKISNEIVQKNKSIVKEELQFLRLNEKCQDEIMDTLRYIHGPDFTLNDASSYEDQKSNLSRKYWIGQGSLVVKGGCDFSQTGLESSDDDRIKQFALLRLESYGFHKNHCIEALNYANGDIEDSIYVLYSKYFDTKLSEPIDDHGLTKQELLEQRIDEKSSLESIYEHCFHEKIANTVWIITLKLNYLVNLFHNTDLKTSRKDVNHNKKPMCRNYVRGNCKFGNKCRFSHKEEVVEKNPNQHLEDYEFELEIRFPPNTNYPYEPPMIFLKTNAVLPPLINLHICKYLYDTAKDLAQNGLPSVYTVIQLLESCGEIMEHLKKEPNFLKPHEKLFTTEITIHSNEKRPTHYTKGMTNKDKRTIQDLNQQKKTDELLVNRFRTTINDSRYQKMLDVRKNLPAWSYKNEILNTIRSSQVCVVGGETGCGKSTQVPQFILDDWLTNYANEHIEIVCTQPRRISAIGVAERVADERVEKCGNTIGYQIRLESKMSSNTRLSFCTTGILLRRLETEPTLSNVTHIIVDEVHERSEESDFLLLILKELLRVRKDLKVILMSATLNSQLFSNYFGGIPVVSIPGRTFSVQQFFLEDILEKTGYVLDLSSKYAKKTKWAYEDIESIDTSHVQFPPDNIKDDNLNIMQTIGRYNNYSIKTCVNIHMMDSDAINNELIETILGWIVDGDHDYPRTGTILIFLPGIAEITSLYDQLNVHPDFGARKKRFVLLPLHSSLTSEEQSAIFRKPKDGQRKIVLSTNLAETSITIDDCIFVIDTGKMKEKHFDPNRNMETLSTVWTTRANALQRKGRAGRVMPGVCIHLFTGHRFRHHMLPAPIPEIQRIPLEQLVLKIKVLSNFAGRNVKDVLRALIEPPVDESVVSAVARLQNVGAVDKAEELTPLGHHLAAMPVDVRIGKLLLYGAIFACVDSALTIAACLNYKNPFVSPFGKRDAANAKKRNFAVANSDHLTVLIAYKKWLSVYKKSTYGARNYATENYLSHTSLLTIVDVKHQLLELLVDIGFVPINLDQKRRLGQDSVLEITGREFNRNGDNFNVLASIICASLYPNVIKILTPSKSYVMSAAGAVPKESEAKELKFATAHEMVFMHPSSVNYSINNFSSPYLVYQEKIRTSRVYFRDSTMVPVIPLVLFSGSDLEITVRNGNTFISLEGGWILFQVEEHKIAEMIKMLRNELFMLLEEKIKDPLLNLLHDDKGERIITTILKLIS